MEIVVVLHNIRSVYNVASIFRTADGALLRPEVSAFDKPTVDRPDGQAGGSPHTRTRKDKLFRWRNSSFGVGVKKIYLVGVTPSPLDRFGKFRADFSKVALGAEKTMEWEHFKNFGAVYKKLKSEGYEILAVEQDKRSIPYYSFNETRDMGQGRDKLSRDMRHEKEKVALIFGEETKGLPKSVLDKCDKILEIPMRGAMVRQAHHPKNEKATSKLKGKESLNVSVAAGIVIYHFAVSGLKSNGNEK